MNRFNDAICAILEGEPKPEYMQEFYPDGFYVNLVRLGELGRSVVGYYVSLLRFSSENGLGTQLDRALFAMFLLAMDDAEIDEFFRAVQQESEDARRTISNV